METLSRVTRMSAMFRSTAARVKARVWVLCIGLLFEKGGRDVLSISLCFDTGHMLVTGDVAK